MPVAKSYQKWNLLGEPFLENNRQYVYIKTNSGKKKVRWYTDQEYAKMYPNEKLAAAGKPGRPWWGPQKDLLGFQKGYIWILKDPTNEEEERLLLNGFRHSTRFWDRYVKSTEDIAAARLCARLVKLPWEAVGEEDGYLKCDDDILAAVDAVRYGDNSSEWVGEPGDREDFILTVIKKAVQETKWGKKVTHIFINASGNELVWETSAKDLELNHTYTIRGTIKELKTEKGKKQTILTRCIVS